MQITHFEIKLLGFSLKYDKNIPAMIPDAFYNKTTPGTGILQGTEQVLNQRVVILGQQDHIPLLWKVIGFSDG